MPCSRSLGVGGGIPACLAGFQAHTQGEVEGSGQGVSRPTPKGDVEGSGQGEGVSRPTPGGSPGPHPVGSPGQHPGEVVYPSMH